MLKLRIRNIYNKKIYLVHKHPNYILNTNTLLIQIGVGQKVWITDVLKGPDESANKYAPLAQAVLNSTTATTIQVNLYISF